MQTKNYATKVCNNSASCTLLETVAEMVTCNDIRSVTGRSERAKAEVFYRNAERVNAVERSEQRLHQIRFRSFRISSRLRSGTAGPDVVCVGTGWRSRVRGCGTWVRGRDIGASATGARLRNITWWSAGCWRTATTVHFQQIYTKTIQQVGRRLDLRA